jgi:hypothetical protein
MPAASCRSLIPNGPEAVVVDCPETVPSADSWAVVCSVSSFSSVATRHVVIADF